MRKVACRSFTARFKIEVAPNAVGFRVSAWYPEDTHYTRGKGPYPTASMARAEMRALERIARKERKASSSVL